MSGVERRPWSSNLCEMSLRLERSRLAQPVPSVDELNCALKQAEIVEVTRMTRPRFVSSSF